MCGVAGYIGSKEAKQIVFDGLKKLEYRGYDSAGIAVLDEGKISLEKAKGKLSNLRGLLDNLSPKAHIAIGHTRWATHGPATKENAHPHFANGHAIVHNGIIENFRELKAELIEKGAEFKSETDTEVILHQLVEIRKSEPDMKKAMVTLANTLKGAFSLGIICEAEPETVFLLKQGSPLVIGLGEGENFFASDALAIIEHTNRIVFLQDGEMGLLTDNSFELFDDAGNTYSREAKELDLDESNTGKGEYKHFMLKEIHEQPAILAKTIQRLVDFENGSFNNDSLGLSGIDFDRVTNIHIIGCGTAYLAGVIGRYAIESIAGIPCQVELASEFRYRDPYLSDGTLVVPITQSGETADTLACVKHAVDAGCQSLAVCNVMYSSIPRASTSTLYMEAGPEIGVASTKAFTSQVLCLYIAAYSIAKIRGKKVDMKNFFEALKILPQQVEKTTNISELIENLAPDYSEDHSCIFIGRHVNSAIALEGALKLKEISYIHAEGYPGGELKHGPIALIDRHMPIVSIAPRDEHYEKMISNIEEVRAREGRILGVGNEGDDKFAALCENFIPVPKSEDTVLQSILNVVALQLFSYHVAVKRGTDVDQPRNLAKSVTVE